MARTVRTLCLLLAILPTACGGNRVPVQPQTPLPSVQGVNFPIRGAHPTQMSSVLAFPNLRFSAPVFLTHAADGSDRLFIVEQPGRIYVFPNDEQTTQKSLFLDISSQVNSAGSEEGLLGLAFDPNYAQNGTFFVYYCYKPAAQRFVRLSRFQVTGGDPNQADPNSEVVLFTVAQPYANHNGGTLAFGPDGYLYLSLGDGGSGGDPHGHAQNLGTLLGSMVRIDVSRADPGLDYAIPHDNPFVGQPGVREEVWAYGLRHPWRFSFDRNTGTLWLGDVGQSNREEVNIIVKGGNYGWDYREGFAAFAGTPPPSFTEVKPVIDYSHSVGRSVIGGYVYRGSTLPELRGAYLYADFTTARIFALVYRNQQIVSNEQIATQGAVASFGEDMHGEVYMVVRNGLIYTLAPNLGTPAGTVFPQKLSETGVFVDTMTLEPNPNLVPFEVTEAFWSDDARKGRWLGVPQGSAISFDPSAPWDIPLGSVLVKHFELPMDVTDPTTTTRLETRVIVHEEEGWRGYVYRWNSQGTDADLLPDSDTRDVTIIDPSSPGGTRIQTWRFPGRANCLECHTSTSNHVLGLDTRQTNFTIDYGPPTGTQNQLTEMHNRGFFGTTNIGDPATLGRHTSSSDTGADRESRVRTYLAVNCAQCHQPNGPGGGLLDLRIDTPLANTGMVDALPQQGDLGIAGARIIAPRDRDASVLYQRVLRLDQFRMPPLGSHRIDTAFLQLLGDWIDNL